MIITYIVHNLCLGTDCASGQETVGESETANSAREGGREGEGRVAYDRPLASLSHFLTLAHLAFDAIQGNSVADVCYSGIPAHSHWSSAVSQQ